jgi:hypothetical protein
MKKTIYIPEHNIEVDREYRQNNISIKDIKTPKGWRLLTFPEWMTCYNKYKKEFKDIENTDEVVQQPIKELRKKFPYWNVWFRMRPDFNSALVGDGRILYCYFRVRGVRFCRDVRLKANN